MAWIATAVTAVATIGGAVSASKAKKADKRANQQQKLLNMLRANQAKRQYLRDFRSQQAAVVSSSVVGGVDIESSRFQAQLGSQRTQAGVATRDENEAVRLGDTVQSFRDKASNYSAQSARYGAVASISSSFIGAGAKPSSDVGGSTVNNDFFLSNQTDKQMLNNFYGK
jgi:hypothetical protein